MAKSLNTFNKHIESTPPLTATAVGICKSIEKLDKGNFMDKL